MARFLISALDPETGLASAAEMRAIDAFNARLAADGHWVFADGLSSPVVLGRVGLVGGRPG
jgi:hypothetical protein